VRARCEGSDGIDLRVEPEIGECGLYFAYMITALPVSAVPLAPSLILRTMRDRSNGFSRDLQCKIYSESRWHHAGLCE
jgi:hypothetical protein